MDTNLFLIIVLTIFFWGDYFLMRRKNKPHTSDVFKIALAITAFLVIFGGATLVMN
ncbi:hypothetical protein [Schleiferilactobacillus perolens]|jgi:hypothetical protein|uniref:Uncharacterized protein n=1 Tax=Schleiferilactobacillus perolens DSM 12744 TaxID=1423792 RepID=A0A0R1MW81_9LACO|nr:hypothetical protein [Schleiferilactobacillus perolens]KRL12422.1 hypothetical protein FD09_GL003005 [Schleiferilactobacillus perolens DSM 12744]MCI1891988.1 hypothetical protein [Schleiferilactobacillus harbinensis]MCI1913428.1 hypothetical protein [Schleiferilactobacillus harbinensis]MCI2170875.1 hypothetical protein [Schleiferilactobacillus perolens]